MKASHAGACLMENQTVARSGLSRSVWPGENAHLHQYLDKTEEQKQFATTGKRISEVKERQQRRKLRELKTAEEKSLWFAKTIGLNLSSA